MLIVLESILWVVRFFFGACIFSFLNVVIDRLPRGESVVNGNEPQIREMLDDIAKNYPGVQVRSFDMNENTYVDSSLQQISQNNCECVLAVYTCGQLGTTASGEEN